VTVTDEMTVQTDVNGTLVCIGSGWWGNSLAYSETDHMAQAIRLALAHIVNQLPNTGQLRFEGNDRAQVAPAYNEPRRNGAVGTVEAIDYSQAESEPEYDLYTIVASGGLKVTTQLPAGTMVKPGDLFKVMCGGQAIAQFTVLEADGTRVSATTNYLKRRFSRGDEMRYIPR